jgi:hypothetical protein
MGIARSTLNVGGKKITGLRILNQGGVAGYFSDAVYYAAKYEVKFVNTDDWKTGPAPPLLPESYTDHIFPLGVHVINAYVSKGENNKIMYNFKLSNNKVVSTPLSDIPPIVNLKNVSNQDTDLKAIDKIVLSISPDTATVNVVQYDNKIFGLDSTVFYILVVVVIVVFIGGVYYAKKKNAQQSVSHNMQPMQSMQPMPMQPGMQPMQPMQSMQSMQPMQQLV